MDVSFVELPPPQAQPIAKLTLQLTATEAKLLAKLLDPTKINDPEKKTVAQGIYSFIQQYDV